MKGRDKVKAQFEVLAIALISLLTVLLCAISVSGSERINVGDKAPNFILQDANETTYELAAMKDNVVILLMGTRKLRGENRKWAAALKESFAEKEEVKIFMIADMRGIPFFLSKEFIKGIGVQKNNLTINELSSCATLWINNKSQKHYLKTYRMRNEQQPVPLLLDWGQNVNKSFGTEEGKINIFVISPDGLILHYETSIRHSEEDCKKLRAKIEELLE